MRDKRFWMRLGAIALLVGGLSIPAALPIRAEIAAPPQPDAPDAGETADPSLIVPEPFDLAAHHVAYIDGGGKWDDAEDLLGDAFKAIYAALADKSVRVTGLPMVEYRDSDDQTFSFRAMVPVEESAKADLGPSIHLGEGPSGHVIRVVHRGPFDELEQVYNRIDDYLAARHLTMQRVVEEYVTDQSVTAPNNQITNIYVFTDPGD